MSLMPLGLLSQGSGSGGAGGNALTLINTQVLVSTAGTITFSSIPSTYKHLQLRIAYVMPSSGDGTLLRFNGDSGANYSGHRLMGSGSVVGAGSQSSASFIFTTGQNWGGNSTPVGMIIDILDYANTGTGKYKTARIFSGRASGSSSGEIDFQSGLWQNTSAISQIDLIGGTSYSVGSRFSLYGVN